MSRSVLAVERPNALANGRWQMCSSGAAASPDMVSARVGDGLVVTHEQTHVSE